MNRKIAFYINIIDTGGAERVMTNLANQFSRCGNEVIFITSYACEKEYFLEQKIIRYNLSSTPYCGNQIKRNFKYVAKLRKICQKEVPDILISFMAEPNMRAVLSTIGLRTKSIVSVRNDPEREYSGIMHKFVGKYLLPLADGCVFQTEEAKNWFPDRLKKKGIIIVNAVKEEFYQKERSPKHHLIVSCGRLEEQKNYPLLLEALCDVIRSYPDVKLKIYGSGTLEERLKVLIDANQLDNCVELKGQTNNVPLALADADLFVMSSDYEGMPNALMEALAMGVPCISTDCPCGGARTLIHNHKNGILVPIRNKDALVDAINSVINDEVKKHNMSDAAKQEATKYREDIIREKWMKYIDDVLKEGEI